MDDTVYLLTNKPTIDELKRLNRETLYLFPLPMMFALLDAGVDLEENPDAIIEQILHVTDEVVELRWTCRKDGKLLAIIGCEGEDGFRALTRKRTASPS
jgi:hypothetical protein